MTKRQLAEEYERMTNANMSIQVTSEVLSKTSSKYKGNQSYLIALEYSK